MSREGLSLILIFGPTRMERTKDETNWHQQQQQQQQQRQEEQQNGLGHRTRRHAVC